ncbi:MAG: hypothetical protein HN392_01050 [Anaerolineae bacterium]|jgi:hypothetical protein|nr:hypothetical protein [Anaerolineae bacterium]MBT7075787.1 hypothetical protein [Anaerolineae bacterium]MBT7781520.1 hypothetical protein [Anaerolineae bacterium]
MENKDYGTKEKRFSWLNPINGALLGIFLILLMFLISPEAWCLGPLSFLPWMLLAPGTVIIEATTYYTIFAVPRFPAMLVSMIAPAILGALFGTKKKEMVRIATILTMIYMVFSVLSGIYIFLHL